MKVTFFSGTPDEFQKVAHLFTPNEAKTEKSSPTKPASEAKDEANEVAFKLTPEIAEKSLTRLPLSENQKRLLRAVLEAGGDGIYISDLATKVGVTRPQLAGVLGALGRRFANTEGSPDEPWEGLIKEKWDQAKAQWKFWPDWVLFKIAERGKVIF